MAGMIISTSMMKKDIMITTEERCGFPLVALLRQQTWLPPAFLTAAYSCSHGLEWAIEAGHIYDAKLSSIGSKRTFVIAQPLLAFCLPQALVVTKTERFGPSGERK